MLRCDVLFKHVRKIRIILDLAVLDSASTPKHGGVPHVGASSGEVKVVEAEVRVWRGAGP